MGYYTIPEGALGLKGTPETLARLEGHFGKLPPTYSLRNGTHEIHMFRAPDSRQVRRALQQGAGRLGLDVLLAGSTVEVEDRPA